MKSINYQMTQLYGVEKHYICKECAKFDPETKMCSEARAAVGFGRRKNDHQE